MPGGTVSQPTNTKVSWTAAQRARNLLASVAVPDSTSQGKGTLRGRGLSERDLVTFQKIGLGCDHRATRNGGGHLEGRRTDTVRRHGRAPRPTRAAAARHLRAVCGDPSGRRARGVSPRVPVVGYSPLALRHRVRRVSALGARSRNGAVPRSRYGRRSSPRGPAPAASPLQKHLAVALLENSKSCIVHRLFLGSELCPP